MRYSRGTDGTRNDDATCRKQYQLLHRSTLRRGIDARQVRESRISHSTVEGSTAFVSNHASEPTGVALGHALPSKRFTNRLWKLSCLIAHRLRQYADGPTFAFVRPASYHITVYNRSHFDRSEVFDLSPSEMGIVERAITEARIGGISIEFNGLVMTPEGRIIVRGFPQGDQLSLLRSCVAQAMPTVDSAPPQLAHIKLGHVLVCPSQSQIRELSDWLGQCGYHVDARLVFTDVYTPLGRLPLLGYEPVT
jgi:hypothetical protein